MKPKSDIIWPPGKKEFDKSTADQEAFWSDTYDEWHWRIAELEAQKDK